MYAKVIKHGEEEWYWTIYDSEDKSVGISTNHFNTKEECRQDIRAVRNASFLIYDEGGQIIAASWPFM